VGSARTRPRLGISQALLPMAETSGATAAGANQMQIWLGDFMACDAVADAEFTGVDTTCG